MKYRPFGRTGMEVSEIAFGCGRTGGLLVHGEEDHMRSAVQKALDGGINWFDTAAAYGSEEALGALLADVEETPYVSTKVKVDAGAPDIPGQIEKSLEGSLTRLRRDSVDLLQIHSRIGDDDAFLSVEQMLGSGGVAETMEGLQKQGLTRFFGLTALGDAGAICEVIESGRFYAAQVYYNMRNPSAARDMPAAWSGQNLYGILKACRKTGTAAMAIRVLVAGLLAEDIPGRRVSMMTGDGDAASEERVTKAIVDIMGSDWGTRAQIAIRFALSNPDISTAIIGMGDPAHVDEAIAAAEDGPLTDIALSHLEAVYHTDFGRA